jgi:hypothetical protein
VLRNPTTQQLAECLGFAGTVDESRVRDVAIVGAGPAGLAAGVYAASEGLDAVVIEARVSRWTGGRELKDRKLHWFPYWHLRTGAHGPRRCPGRKIRRSDVGGATSGANPLRSEAIQTLAGEWRHSAGAQHHHCRWSTIQQTEHISTCRSVLPNKLTLETAWKHNPLRFLVSQRYLVSLRVNSSFVLRDSLVLIPRGLGLLDQTHHFVPRRRPLCESARHHPLFRRLTRLAR